MIIIELYLRYTYFVLILYILVYFFLSLHADLVSKTLMLSWVREIILKTKHEQANKAEENYMQSSMYDGECTQNVNMFEGILQIHML